MTNMILSTGSVIFFCLCCHQFIRSLVTPLPAMNFSSYNRTALRLKKNYQIVAWAIMTFSFLFTLVVTFYQVYAEL